MSQSVDLPLNHSSALIGLNVRLLVEWQTASVLWFVHRWWEELKVSMVTCVWVSMCSEQNDSSSEMKRSYGKAICIGQKFKRVFGECKSEICGGMEDLWTAHMQVQKSLKSKFKKWLHKWVMWNWGLEFIRFLCCVTDVCWVERKN